MGIDEKYKEACEYLRARGIDPFNMQNGIKNTETAPKYDPNRKFRKGDKVRVVEERSGRIPPLCGDIEPGEFYTVSDDEDGGDVMLDVKGKYDCIEWYWLELVTTVEELELFTIRWSDCLDAWQVQNKDKDVIATFFTEHPHAKAAAEAERDRLNAEWRKEK